MLPLVFANYGFHPRVDNLIEVYSKVLKLDEWFNKLKTIQFGISFSLKELALTIKNYADKKRKDL